MIKKKDLMFWIYDLEDKIDNLIDDVEQLEKRVKKFEPKKGKKNETKK